MVIYTLEELCEKIKALLNIFGAVKKEGLVEYVSLVCAPEKRDSFLESFPYIIKRAGAFLDEGFVKIPAKTADKEGMMIFWAYLEVLKVSSEDEVADHNIYKMKRPSFLLLEMKSRGTFLLFRFTATGDVKGGAGLLILKHEEEQSPFREVIVTNGHELEEIDRALLPESFLFANVEGAVLSSVPKVKLTAFESEDK